MRRLLRVVACAAVALVALMASARAASALRFEAEQTAAGPFEPFHPGPPASGKYVSLLGSDLSDETAEPKPLPWEARAMEVGSYACWGVAGLALIYAVWPARREGDQS